MNDDFGTEKKGSVCPDFEGKSEDGSDAGKCGRRSDTGKCGSGSDPEAGGLCAADPETENRSGKGSGNASEKRDAASKIRGGHLRDMLNSADRL